MSAHRAGTDRALARGDSRNVAELAHMTGRLRQSVRGMSLTGAARLAERDAQETLFTIPIGHRHGRTKWLLAMSYQRHCCINPLGSSTRRTAMSEGQTADPLPVSADGTECAALATCSLIALASARSRSVSARWYLIAMSAVV